MKLNKNGVTWEMEKGKKQSKLKRIMAKRGMGQVITVTIGLVALVIVFGFLNQIYNQCDLVSFVPLK